MFNFNNNRLLIISVATLTVLVFLSLAPAIHKWADSNTTITLFSLNSNQATLSPDGKFAGYVFFDNAGEHGIRLRLLANNSETTLVKLNSNDECLGLSFNSESNALYYTIKKATGKNGEMFRVSINGGDVNIVLPQADSKPGFSPDGKQFTYFLNHLDQSQKGIRISNSDGSNDKLLIPFPLPEKAVSEWSPDGKSLAYVSYCPDGNVCISEHIFADGSRKTFGSKFADINSIQWFSDKKDLIVSARLPDSLNSQIFRISYPEGDTFPVTIGFDSYLNLRMSADSYRAVAIKTKELKDLWIVSTNNPSETKQITKIENLHNNVSWSPDGTVLTVDVANNMSRILFMDRYGNNIRKFETNKWSSHPFVSSDGKFFIYFSKAGIWRADINGSNQRLIARVAANGYSMQRGVQLTPDGKWIVGNFADGSNKTTLRKINIDTGESFSLSDKPLSVFAISHDGNQLAYLDKDEHENLKIFIRPFENAETIKRVDFTSNAEIDFTRLRWTRDNSGIVFNATDGDSSNLRLQPISGEQAKQLTDFPSGIIYDFDLSNDGKEIVLIRGTRSYEVVQMKNLR